MFAARPILAYWNQAGRQWVDVASSCPKSLAHLQPSPEAGKVQVQVCETNLNAVAAARPPKFVPGCTCSTHCAFDACVDRCTVASNTNECNKTPCG